MGEQLYEGTHEQLHRLSMLISFHWAVQLSPLTGDTYTNDGESWLPLTAAPDQPIESGRYWYLVGDINRPYGAFEYTEWPIVVDLTEKTANIPIKHL